MSTNVLVRDIMTKKVKVAREDTNLHEIIAIFNDKREIRKTQLLCL